MEMVMAFKKFDVPRSTETVSFELADYRFVCRPQIAAGALLKFGKGVSRGDDKEGGGGIGMLNAITDFFRACLMPGDFDRYMALIEDPDVAIPMETLVEITGWLGEVYSGGRPTGESLPSTSDKLSSGAASMDGASVATPTYSRSPETAPST